MSDHNEPTKSGGLPSVTLQPVVGHPDCGGFWWMNMPSEYGWEPVDVVYSHGKQKIYRLGRGGEPFEMPSNAKGWIQLHKPNPSLQGTGHLVDRTLQGVVGLPK